ncbi:MAG: cation diffusion facilitator family transporter [Solirubrobacteraceae bacterium]
MSSSRPGTRRRAHDGGHDHTHDGEHGRSHDGEHSRSHDGEHDHTHADGRSHTHAEGHGHAHGNEHGHSHGLVARSILRSRAGIRAVSWSLLVLLLTALGQTAVFYLTGSIALLADLIHNFGDALTAIPLGIAFLLRSATAEKRAGLFVVLAIFVSACVALGEAINRLISPQPISHLWVLALAGVVGFVGNELAAQVRLHAGRRLESPALIADGYHARTDGFVSLAVVASAIVLAIGLRVADPIIGLLISLVIMRITWQSLRTVQADPGEGEFGEDGRDVAGHAERPPPLAP